MIVDLLKLILPEAVHRLLEYGEELNDWLTGLLGSNDKLSEAITLVSPIIQEMISTGGGRLDVRFRAPYELRMMKVLDAAGLLEET